MRTSPWRASSNSGRRSPCDITRISGGSYIESPIRGRMLLQGIRRLGALLSLQALWQSKRLLAVQRTSSHLTLLPVVSAVTLQIPAVPYGAPDEVFEVR